jgi:hypothetical protein
VAGHNNGVFLPRQMLEHVLSQNKSQIMPEHVLVMLAKTENRDFGLRQNVVEQPGPKWPLGVLNTV